MNRNLFNATLTRILLDNKVDPTKAVVIAHVTETAIFAHPGGETLPGYNPAATDMPGGYVPGEELGYDGLPRRKVETLPDKGECVTVRGRLAELHASGQPRMVILISRHDMLRMIELPSSKEAEITFRWSKPSTSEAVEKLTT